MIRTFLALVVIAVAFACRQEASSTARSAQIVATGGPQAPSGGKPLPEPAPNTSPAAEKRPAAALQPPATPQPPTTAGEFTVGVVEYKPQPKEVALLTDVRAAKHEGFDRVVFEFASGPLPGYHVEYIDKPVRKCGSGDATPIAGDGWLEVRFEPANAHTPSGVPTIADREQKPNLVNVKEIELTCDFEAQVTWAIGVGSPNKYRVLTLDDPLRLVIDVKQ